MGHNLPSSQIRTLACVRVKMHHTTSKAVVSSIRDTKDTKMFETSMLNRKNKIMLCAKCYCVYGVHYFQTTTAEKQMTNIVNIV